ncbi:CBS domain-containing protein [Halorubrum alkaliphilum]|uniref:CBS domain-containing protein n=1 Tax=Halorubrum alkaliphilum TaxID=261290 RepID=A0A8T4GJU9_9EURY|nr:CBS domain-containing protein [Halorubrum alkaliphilum]MBP1923342.1 CBS domain-containing protein [Halorubrum alkaliphilum]
MRTDTTVRDVMHREFLGVSESDPLADAAALLVEEGTDCSVVLRGGEAVGRLAARDALGGVLDGVAGTDAGTDDAGETNGGVTTVGDVMRPPLPTVAPDDALVGVDELLVAEGVSRVVVADDGEAVGVVTAQDSLAAGTTRPAGAGSSAGEPGVAGDGAERTPGDASPTGAQDAARGSDRARTASSTDASGASTQGVCEVCGALAPELANANGQAVCPNCREV